MHRIKLSVRKGMVIMFTALSILLTSILLLMILIILISPGNPKPFLDENGNQLKDSISEKTFIMVNGVKQGMFIESKDTTKPVLLILHGGPGMPYYAFRDIYPTGLEDYFTICWWEQRGSGLSYSKDVPAETMTMQQLTADTIEVTNYLRKRFHQDKIYIMAHSWGSYLGIHVIKKEPQLYHAYIGIAQISCQLESEKIAYQYMTCEFSKEGNTKMVKKLKEFPIMEMDYLPEAYGPIRDEAMHRLGIGTTRNMHSVVSGIFIPVMKSRAYTFPEKINIWRGKLSSYSASLRKDMYNTDLTTQASKLDVPVYLFHGLYDYTVSYPLAKAYFDTLEAPEKYFYTFEHSAHSPFFEEPQKFITIIKNDVLKY